MAHGIQCKKKCASLTITRKRTPIQHNYKLANETIPRADKYKYLGGNHNQGPALEYSLPTYSYSTRLIKPLACWGKPCHHAPKRLSQKHTCPWYDLSWSMALRLGILTPLVLLKASKGYRKRLLVLLTATTEDPHRPQGLSPNWDGINCTHVAS